MKGNKFLIFTHKGHFFNVFLKENIVLLQKLGFEVHCAGNFEEKQDLLARSVLENMGVVIHQIDVCRSPYALRNIQAYRQLKELLSLNEFAAVHCHTPTGGVLGRLAARNWRRDGLKVLYTVHGFHFYKGAPLLNWLLFYPVERLCAHWTDVLITINREDYERAKTFKARRVEYVPGVGIELGRFHQGIENRDEKRESLGIGKNDFALLSVGELIKRKNHAVVLDALGTLKEKGKLNHIQYIICGCGILDEELKQKAALLGIADHVHFLGYRNDINEICNASDLFVFMSHQEGLPVALMEAMACGLPVICSDIRGNTDLIENEKSGEIVENNPSAIAKAIEKISGNAELRERYANAAKLAIRDFELTKVQSKMMEIYKLI